MCFDIGDGKPLFITDHDASTPLAACYPLHEVSELARLSYYAAKLFKHFGGSTPPPP